MKKRNCRKTPEEIERHDFAVKLRKMTDKQLCDWMDELQGKSMDHERFVMKCGVNRYLFLTKRVKEFFDKDYAPWDNLSMDVLNRFWVGISVTRQSMVPHDFDSTGDFWSVEPLLEPIKCDFTEMTKPKWVIIGAETGSRKEKVFPQRAWIENIVNQCRTADVPVFMKSSLTDIWGVPLIQQFPWEEKL